MTFGLALYDKQQREVTGAMETGDRPRTWQASNARATPLRVVASRASKPQPGQEPVLAASKPEPPIPEESARPVDPGLVPLDPATIQQLCDTLRALPRPALEGFTKAFRKRFQVPAEAPSIVESRHSLWSCTAGQLIGSDFSSLQGP